MSRKWTRKRSILLAILRNQKLHTHCKLERDKNVIGQFSLPSSESELHTPCELEMDKNEVNPACDPEKSEFTHPLWIGNGQEWDKSCL